MVYQAAKHLHPHVNRCQHAFLRRGDKGPSQLHPGQVLEGIGAEVKWKCCTEWLTRVATGRGVKMIHEPTRDTMEKKGRFTSVNVTSLLMSNSCGK